MSQVLIEEWDVKQNPLLFPRVPDHRVKQRPPPVGAWHYEKGEPRAAGQLCAAAENTRD